jgi:hypothetical protein
MPVLKLNNYIELDLAASVGDVHFDLNIDVLPKVGLAVLQDAYDIATIEFTLQANDYILDPEVRKWFKATIFAGGNAGSNPPAYNIDYDAEPFSNPSFEFKSITRESAPGRIRITFGRAGSPQALRVRAHWDLLSKV